MLSIRIKLL